MKLKELNKEKASKNYGEAKAVDIVETYDLSVQKAAALLASKKHSCSYSGGGVDKRRSCGSVNQ